MPEPRIDRVKTEVYFVDAHGTEWRVLDLERRPDGRWRETYPTAAGATYRSFRRQRLRGQWTPIDLEVRVYRFRPGEDRWFVAGIWQKQVEAAVLRGIRIPGVPPLADGYLLER